MSSLTLEGTKGVEVVEITMAMDFPINWAHQQDRKAEGFVNHQKFAEAIVCHQRAAEFLQEAMNMTQVQQALISMQLQFENHCRQQKVVKDKWRRCEIQREKLKREQVQMLHLREKQKQEMGENVEKGSDKGNDKKATTECLQSSSLVISAENFSVSSTSSSSDCIASKDEKTKIKELETQVSELQMQVLSLSQNLEDCNRENSRLKKALDSVYGFVKCKFGYELGDELFDVNQVKDQCCVGVEALICETDAYSNAKQGQDCNTQQGDELALEDNAVMNTVLKNTNISLPPLESALPFEQED